MFGAEFLYASSSTALPGSYTSSAELMLLVHLFTAPEMMARMLNAVLVSDPMPDSQKYEDLSCSVGACFSIALKGKLSI